MSTPLNGKTKNNQKKNQAIRPKVLRKHDVNIKKNKLVTIPYTTWKNST